MIDTPPPSSRFVINLDNSDLATFFVAVCKMLNKTKLEFQVAAARNNPEYDSLYLNSNRLTQNYDVQVKFNKLLENFPKISKETLRLETEQQFMNVKANWANISLERVALAFLTPIVEGLFPEERLVGFETTVTFDPSIRKFIVDRVISVDLLQPDFDMNLLERGYGDDEEEETYTLDEDDYFTDMIQVPATEVSLTCYSTLSHIFGSFGTKARIPYFIIAAADKLNTTTEIIRITI